MNLERRLNLLERKSGISDFGPERGSRIVRDPITGKTIEVPRYIIDYIIRGGATVDKFDTSKLSNIMTGLKDPTFTGRTKRNLLEDQPEDVVVTFK